MPQKAGAQAAIRLLTAVIKFRNKERNVKDVLRNVKLLI